MALQIRKLPLFSSREMVARENTAGADWSNGFFQQFLHLEFPFAVGTHLIGTATGAVRRVMVAPVIKADAVRVWAIVSMMENLKYAD
ncbi:MAG: hypothetical protein CM1200mP29_06400 [Verrucomicrobiota bacterium]|nr:MAG: hypothetical protein CM1200mP29_06400 [Verrucomicrobiota bacterium]